MTDQIAEAQPVEMSETFSAFNFNELRFLLDNFYGLKPEHNITNFLDFFMANDELMTALIGTDSDQFDAALSRFLHVSLDDGYSGFGEPSWRSQAAREQDDETLSDNFTAFGPSNRDSFTTGERFTTARKEAFPDGVPMY